MGPIWLASSGQINTLGFLGALNLGRFNLFLLLVFLVITRMNVYTTD